MEVARGASPSRGGRPGVAAEQPGTVLAGGPSSHPRGTIERMFDTDTDTGLCTKTPSQAGFRMQLGPLHQKSPGSVCVGITPARRDL